MLLEATYKEEDARLNTAKEAEKQELKNTIFKHKFEIDKLLSSRAM